MSLQVWLPLNGNLNNQGLSNVTVTNNGATVNDSGKIGKCYQLGQNKKITSVIDIHATPISASLWIYLDSFQDTCNYILSLNNSGGYSDQCIAIALESTTKIVFCVGGNTGCFYNSQETLVGKWTHLAVTFDGSKIKGYLNGVEVCSLSSTASLKRSNLTLGCRNGNTTYYTNCKLNDVRIYDHCLSPKEVREISKGLVLHYTLNNIPNKNLISSLRSYSPTRYQAYQFNLSENFVAGETYTFQLWDVDVSHSGKTEAQLGISIYWGGGSVGLRTMNGTSWFTNGHADYIKFSITITSSQASGSDATNSWINIYNSVPSATGTLDMSIGKIKIEKGNAATTYTNFNESQQIVYDTSGYGNNGTITGSLSVTNDSPRHNLSSKYMNSATSILIGNLSTMVPEKIFTFNIWFKKITGEWSTKGWETILGGPSGFEFQTKRSSTNSPLLVAYSWGQNSSGGQEYELDKWNMLTIVRTTSNAKFYLNGELYYTGSAGSIPSGNYFIGSRSTATSQNYRGCLSDARIYSTALSDDDIKELYDTAALIDNGHNLHCYEFVEDDVTSPMIEKNGLVKTNEFNEYPDDYIFYDYIESTGTQWINTNYPYDSSNNTYKIICKWKFTGVNSTYQAVYGAYTGENYKTFRIIRGNSNNKLYTYSNSKAVGGNMYTLNQNIFQDFITIHTCNDITYNGVKYTLSASDTGSQTTSTFYVMAQSSNNCVSKIKIWYFKIFESNVLKLYLIPAKRKSDNAIGMYDMATGRFFGNSGTGTFTTGTAIDVAAMYENKIDLNQLLEI